MKKCNVINMVFHHDLPISPRNEKGLAFAPTNIALSKYWGKRDVELNLPVTSSLSIALPDKGTMTYLTLQDEKNDTIIVNDVEMALTAPFAERLIRFLDLFRHEKKWRLHIDIKVNIPIAAGLASSASGFASLVSALNDLCGWDLSKQQLSILARIGSGSAARSFWMGFVEWYAGVQTDGMDSFATPIETTWPELRIGILTLSDHQKAVSSSEAMQRTVNSSALYSAWPKKVAQDMAIIKQAINVRNFPLLAGTAESNALTMHATMLSSWPPICYSLPETIAAMQKIWQMRHDGVEVYFTQDAGPNLKLLFLDKHLDDVKKAFPAIEVINVFESA